MFPVRLTTSPSLTSRSEPKSTTPTWPASKFMHMPLTPDANLNRQSDSSTTQNLLDQFLGLDIVHAMDTSNTVTVASAVCLFSDISIPNRENTTSLGETGIFLNSSNALLKDRRDLSRGCFRVSIASALDGLDG